MMLPKTEIAELLRWVEAACVMEVLACKAGNVHPFAPFHDTTYLHFIQSASAIHRAWNELLLKDALEIDGSPNENPHSVGELVFRGVQATREEVGVNTNLGIILLLGPLLRAKLEQVSIKVVLQQLTCDDAARVYQAIHLARPGGLGKVDQHDVSQSPPDNLTEAMKLAEHQDDIAKQYVNGFVEVHRLADRLQANASAIRLQFQSWSDYPELDRLVASKYHREILWLSTIRKTQIEWLAEYPDSLIRRKLGDEEAGRVQVMAKEVVASGNFGSPEYEQAWKRLDNYLRQNGNVRNPGTTADLLAAALFCLQCDGISFASGAERFFDDLTS